MTDLKDRISDATKAAIKARAKARVAVMRMVNADIKRVEVDERVELDDDGVLAVLNRMLKQRKDALSQYRDAGRDDLARRTGQSRAEPDTRPRAKHLHWS